MVGARARERDDGDAADSDDEVEAITPPSPARADHDVDDLLLLRFTRVINGDVVEETIAYDLCDTADDGHGRPWSFASFDDLKDFVHTAVIHRGMSEDTFG